VLDLGCGTGLCGPLLAPWAGSLTGIDVSRNMLDEAARKQLYERLVEAEITAWLPAQDAAAYDLAIATDVFIYIGDLAPVFAGLHRVLRPGGLFAFSTEVSEGAESRLLESLRYAHSAAYLERLAREAGWDVESVTTHVLREEDRQGVCGHLAVLRRRG
jgi:predicted TPR repeat methyltransferase